MLEQKLQQRYLARNNEDVVRFVGEQRKLIVLERPLDTIPAGYTQITMTYKEEQHIVLIPEKVKFYLANPGEDGRPLDALDEIADFYQECKDFEHELQLGGKFLPTQTNVSTLARTSYQVWTINQLIQQSKGSETPIWKEEELERLGVNDPYISDRLRGIAALMLGKRVEELQEAGLDQILEHKTVKGTYKEMLSEKEFDEITCWAGSHYELKPEFRNAGYDIEHLHDRGYKKGWKIMREKDFANLPQIETLEQEIEAYRKEQGKETTRHDQALLRTYTNLKFIVKEDPTKQLDVIDDA